MKQALLLTKSIFKWFVLLICCLTGSLFAQPQQHVFDTPDLHQFTIPPGVTEITIQVWGGGGAGGSGTVQGQQIRSGGGGGGGSYSQQTIAVTSGGILSITVGSGGLTNGTNGDSSFVTYGATTIISLGGNGGNNATTGGGGGSGSGGLGGIGSTFNGGNGASGISSNNQGNGGYSGGGGGSAGTDSSGNHGNTTSGGAAVAGGGAGGDGTASNNTSGTPGLAPGGGGGGGRGTNGNGGHGAHGQVIISYTIPDPDPDTSTITAASETLTADGISNTTITLQLKYPNGDDVTTGGHNIILATTAGTISGLTDNGDGSYSAVLTAGTQLQTAVVSGTIDEEAVADTASIEFIGGPPTQLVFEVEPSDAILGQDITPSITVHLLDQYNNLSANANNSVHIAIDHDASANGNALLNGTTIADASAGIVVFNDLSIDKSGNGFTLTVVSSELNQATSVPFNITTPALRLQYLNFNTNPSSQTLYPLLTVFNDATLDLDLTDITIRYYFTSEPPGTDIHHVDYALVGSANITGQFIEELGLRYLEVGFTAGATIPPSHGGNSIPNEFPGGANTGEIQNRIVDSNWGFYDQTDDYSWDPDITSWSDYENITIYYKGELAWGVSPGPASGGVQLHFLQQPTITAAGETISPPITVRIEDAEGNLVADSDDEVIISLTNNPSGATFFGTTAVNAVNGIAAFDDFAFSNAGNGFIFTASSPGMQTALSEPFTITEATTANLRLQYKNGSVNPVNNVITPFMILHNDGQADIPLTAITIRYWFSSEPPGNDIHVVDWAAVGKDYVTGAFFGEGDQRYLEIGFTADAIVHDYHGGANSNILMAGAHTGQVQQRIHDTAWADYDQSNDHSWDPSFTDFADYEYITVYYNGMLVWGYPVPPDILFVRASATGGNDGSSWGDAFINFQDALDAADPGSTIWVAAGTYYPNNEAGGIGDRFKSFQMKDNVEIYGGFAGHEDPSTFDLDSRDFVGNETILDGEVSPGIHAYHVFRHENLGLTPSAVLDGFTIRGGMADAAGNDGRGGGMLNTGTTATNGSSPTIRNCIFRNNSATDGGGMFNSRYSSPEISNTSFISNIAGNSGGAVYNTRNNAVIAHSIFNSNQAHGTGHNFGGGAIYSNAQNASEGPVIISSGFINNSVSTTEARGGAIFNNMNPGTASIEHCEFFNNAAQYGGAIYSSSGNDTNRDASEIVIDSSVFEGNEAEYGGAVFSDRHHTMIYSSWLRGNEASQHGGAFYGRFASSQILNSQISGNKSQSQGGALFFNNERPVITNTTISGNFAAIRGGGASLINETEVTFRNSILWGSGSPDGNELRIDSDSGAEFDHSLFANGSGDVVIISGGTYTENNSLSANPLFLHPITPTSGNTPNTLGNYMISGNSPAVDAGLNSNLPALIAKDIRGEDRLIDGNLDSNTIVDVGAFEFNPLIDAMLPYGIILGGPANAVAGNESTQFTITTVDVNGTPSPVSEATTFSLSSSVFATVFNPSSTVTIAEGESTVNFTYNSDEAGQHLLAAFWVSGEYFLTGSFDTHEITILPGAANQFAFKTAPAVIPENIPANFVLEVQDEHGNPTTNHSGFTNIVTVSGNAGTLIPASVDLTSDVSQVSFNWQHNSPGQYTLTANAGGVDAINHDIEIVNSASPQVFSYYKLYETDHTRVAGSAALTDFPLLFSYTHPDYRHVSNGGKIHSFDGHDIVFTADDAITLWDHDLEYYDPVNGTIVAWIRFPSLSATENTAFYIHYGNSNINNSTSTATTWDNDYRLVMHLNENLVDASTYNNVATNSGTTPSEDGKIGGARSFAVPEFFQVDDNTSLDVSNAISISFWVNFSNVDTGPDLITKGFWTESYSTYVTVDREPVWVINNNQFFGGPVITNNTWQYIVLTMDNSGWNIYLDGASILSGSQAFTINTVEDDLYVSTTAFPFAGLMDEIRISSVARSADWIATKYNNQDDPDNFLTRLTPDPDPAETTISANPEAIIANGSSTSLITVQAKDADGNDITVGGAEVLLNTTAGSLSPVMDHGDGTYSALLTATIHVETATISGSINGDGITDQASVDFIAGLPAKLQFSQQPSTGFAGDIISPPISVIILDDHDNLVDNATMLVYISILNNPGNGNLDGIANVVTSGGTGIFDQLFIDSAGLGYTLQATSAGLNDATSESFDMIATSFAYDIELTGPSSAIAGIESSIFELTVIDDQGDPTPVVLNTTFGLSTTAESTATFLPAATITIPAGQSNTSFTYINTLAGTHSVTATWLSGDNEIDGASDSHQIMISPAAPYQFAFKAAPGTVSIYSPASFIVEVQDEYNNPNPNHGGHTDVISVSGDAGLLEPTQVSIPEGAAETVFTWTNDQEGLFTITASNSLAAATHDIEVLGIPDPASFFLFKEFEVNHEEVAGATGLIDFPVLFDFTHDYFRHTGSNGHVNNINGYDIIFTNADGSEVFDHELELYDADSGRVIAWVRFPNLSATTNTPFRVYYGNPYINMDLSQPTTWDNDYRLVTHLMNDIFDASTYNNNSNFVGTTPTPSGKIGFGHAFESGEYITFDHSAALNLTDHITISLWVNTSDLSETPDLVTKGFWNEGYSLWIRTEGTLRAIAGSGTPTSTGTINIGDWTYVAFTKGPGGRAFYIDGVQSGTDTDTSPIQSILDELYISSPDFLFEGIMDEVRISAIARSADWIATKYNNQNDPDDFIINMTNYPPVLANIETTALEYTEGDGEVSITQSITVSDPNDDQLAGATIQITGNYSEGEDVLAFTNTGSITGSFDASQGIMSLSGSALLSAYQDALRSVTYQNTSENPSTDIRTVSFVANDGEFNSNELTRDIVISALSSPPVLADIEIFPLAYGPGDGQLAITSSITVSDPDSPELIAATIVISNNYIIGEDILDFPGYGDISGVWDATSGILSMNGAAGVADYQEALRLVTYENTSSTPSQSVRTISFTVNDGVFDSNTLSREVDIVAEGAFPGLLLWLKGEEGTFQDLGGSIPATNNGEPVREWHDQSGNNRIFSTNGTPPTLATNVPELNGRSAIRFAGTGDELVDMTGPTYINGLNEFTIFIVIKSDRTDTDRGFWHTKVPDGQDDIFTIRYDEEGFYADPLPVNNIKLGILNDSPPNQIESYSDVQVTEGQIVMVQWRSGDTYDLFVDGIINNPALLFDPPEGSLFGATRALIGKGSKDGNTSSWDGLIGEVILYNRKLETAERLQTEDYLSEKYGISIRHLTPARGGEAISADDVGGDFTLLTGPVIKEGFRGQLITGGTFVLKVPDGFEWDTGGAEPIAHVSPVYGGFTDLNVSFTSRNSDYITFTIDQSSSASVNSRIGQIDFEGLRVRPLTGQLPNEGIILNVGTTGFAGQTNYGPLRMITGSPNKLKFTQHPVNTTIGLPINPAVRVRVYDQFNNPVPEEGIAINIDLIEGSGTLSGGQNKPTDAIGQTVFEDLRINDTGIKKIRANAASLIPAESNLFKILLDGVFTNFIIEETPAGDITSKIAGQEFQITITAVDGNGITDTDFDGTVVITSNGTLDAGLGTTPAFVNGILDSHTVSLTSAGTFAITATHSAGTETGISNQFQVSPGAASPALSIVQAIPAVITNDGISTSEITVRLKDAYENPLNTGGDAVSVFSTAGSLSPVTDNGDGTYTALLTSSIEQTTAVVSGLLNGAPMTNTAQVIFAQFDFIWQGTLGDAPTADQWDYAPNWNNGIVPGSGNAVLIPSNPAVGNKFPVVDITNTIAGSVLVETGANLTISGGVNFIVEDFLSGNGAIINGSNQDTLTIGGMLDINSISLGTVVFNGTLDQSISSPHIYTNMVIDNPGTVFANDNLIVNGLLHLEDGILRIPNNRVLIANNKLIGNGQLQFVRSITGPKGWRMLGSPVASTYGDLLDGTLTQGYTGSSLGTHFADQPLQPNVFWYDETFEGTDNERWRAPQNATDPLIGGRGLYVYFFGNIPEDPRYNNPLPDTLVVTGHEFEGDGIQFDFNITYTAEADTGWNFISNPFGASLNWDSPGWTKTNIDNTIYIWKPTANNGHGEFLTWNGSSGTLGNGLIRPFQGFWVKANTPGAELKVNKSAKTTGGTFHQKDAAYNPYDIAHGRTFSYPDMMNDTYDPGKPMIILKATSGGLEAHKTITFREEASIQKDAYDGYRLLPLEDSFIGLFSALENGSELVVNNLPKKFSNRIRIPIHVAGYIQQKLIIGPYTISWPSLRDIPSDWVLFLIDNETGERINMLEQNRHTFNLINTNNYQTYPGNNPGDDDYRLVNTNYDKARFTLVISNSEIEETIPWDLFLTQNFPNPFAESTTIRFGLAEDSSVSMEVFDIKGKMIESLMDDHLNAGYHEYIWTAHGLPSGIYFVVLKTEKDLETFKMTLIR